MPGPAKGYVASEVDVMISAADASIRSL